MGEGFVGGGIATVVLGPVYALFLQSFPSLICPSDSQFQVSQCDPSLLPLFLSFPLFGFSVTPFIVHCTVISIFASTIGPVAGSYAVASRGLATVRTLVV